MTDMNGAQALLRTLVACGVDVCFSNPGTSEVHFVAALDDVPEMRGVLGLFEGVVTGAADGYARMTGTPAATLLHLGPGLGNELANLHHARRARTPMINVVGDHALHHKSLDAPLESDIDSVAASVSGWVRRSESVAAVAADAAQAVAAACSGAGIATLILPADVSWSSGAVPASQINPTSPPAVSDVAIDDVARTLTTAGSRSALLVGGATLNRRGVGSTGSHLQHHRCQGAARDVPGPDDARRWQVRARQARIPRRDGHGPAQRHRAPHLGGSARTRRILRLSRQAQPVGAQRMHRAQSGRAGH